MISDPIIRNTSEFSGPCERGPVLKDLHRIPRTLPRRHLKNEDPEVLQDEFGAAINDEITNGFIYDDLRG